MGASAAGQLLALGLNPASVQGPIPIPAGNRHGEFAAGPEGKPDAPGTPELKPGGNSAGGAGSRAAEGAGNSAPGITVAPAPNVPTSLSSSGGAIAQLPSRVAERPPDSEPQQIAKLEPPHLPAISAPDEGLESQVFGGKKYYSLTLNMPNLTSAGGSWIIRFAELDQAPVSGAAFAHATTVVPEGELTAPVAVEKVDPAYPPELMADRIEGVVTLYAVIHSDGTVSDIHVLRSVEDRLDHNAIHALERWRFRPATRNGAPVNLEAVVQIPFRLRKGSF
jgi:TonB family protein